MRHPLINLIYVVRKLYKKKKKILVNQAGVVRRYLRDGRTAGAQQDVRLSVREFAIRAPSRALLLATVSVLLPGEHPLPLSISGEVSFQCLTLCL